MSAVSWVAARLSYGVGEDWSPSRLAIRGCIDGPTAHVARPISASLLTPSTVRRTAPSPGARPVDAAAFDHADLASVIKKFRDRNSLAA
jgi:hypothetical protein